MSITNLHKNFCPAPFRQLSIGPKGELTPCCLINNEGFGKVNGDSVDVSLDEILNGKEWQDFLNAHRNEQMPEICIKHCSWSGATAEYHNQWQWAIGENWIEKEVKIERADISFSNICNLTCTMCNETFSSEWMKEKPELDVKSWNFSEKQSKELATLVKDCKVINIKGGEPLMNQRFLSFLKELSTISVTPHLPVLSNGTVMNDEILEELSKFSQPTIAFSLESTDDRLYSFIRGGKFSYSDTILKNLKHIKQNFPKIKVKVNYLIGAFNIDNMFKDMEKLIDDGFDEINVILISVGPIEQSLTVVHPSVKNPLADKFLKYVNEHSDKFFTLIKDNVHLNVANDLRSPTFEQIPKEELDYRIDTVLKARQKQKLNLNDSILDLVPNYYVNMTDTYQ
jgi:MoaA/NifB/PqqE/SkfB family radical SAM enzyme